MVAKSRDRLEGELRGYIVAKRRSLANVFAYRSQRAMSGLLHDVELARAIHGGLASKLRRKDRQFAYDPSHDLGDHGPR